MVRGIDWSVKIVGKMDDGAGCCLGIVLIALLILILGVGFFVMVYWQVILIFILVGFLFLIVFIFRKEMAEAIRAVGRGIEVGLGWMFFEISKITTPEERGANLMINENVALEQLKNRSIDWNEQTLRENFQYLAQQAFAPIIVKNYWDFLKQQFQLNRQTKLSEERNKWLLTEVAKYQNLLQLLGAYGDLEAFPLQHKNRMLEEQIRNQRLKQELQMNDANENDEKEIQSWRNKERLSELQLGVAQNEKARQDIFNPPKPQEAKQPTAEERRNKELQEIEVLIAKAERGIEEARSRGTEQGDINRLVEIVHNLKQRKWQLEYGRYYER